MTSPDPSRPYPSGMLDGLGGIAAWANKTREEYEADILGKIVESTEKIKRVGAEFRDGQLDINDRVDLLSPLQDYGSVYMNEAQGWSQTGEMPFTNQVGPMIGCHRAGSRIILDDKGLWDINAQLWFDYIDILTDEVQWRIEVLRPNGSVYSQMQIRFDERNPHSSLNMTSVVVPESGYQVRVWVNYIANLRGILGGPSLNRLTVKHISRDITTGNTGQG